MTLGNLDTTNWADEVIAKLKLDFANGALGVKVWKNIGMTHKDSSNQFVMIDNPNTPKELIYDRAIKLVQQLKKNRPQVPVLLVENYLLHKNDFMPKGRLNDMAKRVELQKAYQFLKNSGIRNLYYLKGDHLISNDHEATVDGTHPTDLGMQRIAQALLPEITKILKKKTER